MGNSKNLLAIVASVFSLGIVLGLLLVPIDGFTVPGSYRDLKEKSDTSSKLNHDKRDVLMSVSKQKNNVKEKEVELEKVTEASNKSQELFNEIVDNQSGSGDWSFHVPSLLIRLEDAADKRDVKLAMDYETFKKEGDFVSESKQGLKVVKINVEIYGNYGDVQSYLKAVEGINFVSLEDLVLKRVKNGKLAGNYHLNVYYLDK